MNPAQVIPSLSQQGWVLIIKLHSFNVSHIARGYGHLLEEEKEPSFLTAGVGDYIVLNCDLDFPHEIPIPYILRWSHEVSSKMEKKNMEINEPVE